MLLHDSNVKLIRRVCRLSKAMASTGSVQSRRSRSSVQEASLSRKSSRAERLEVHIVIIEAI